MRIFCRVRKSSAPNGSYMQLYRRSFVISTAVRIRLGAGEVQKFEDV
jgi:hypothetical protein